MRNKARIIVLIWQSLWLYRGTVHAREADDRQNYLFAHDPDAANLIQEYKVDLGNIDEYFESSGQEMPEEEIHRIPSFLTSNYEFDRVVNFYSPWCAHCQKVSSRKIFNSIMTLTIHLVPDSHVPNSQIILTRSSKLDILMLLRNLQKEKMNN